MTRFDRTVLYSTYEVTRLLRLGENVLGVMLGTGWYSEKSAMRPFAEWYHHPKFLLSLDLQWPDLQRKTICSDPSWKSSDGPVVYNYIRCGERYDARLEKKGFDCPDYNDTDWAEAHICRSPGGVLKPAELPPIRVVDTLPMKEIAPSLYDCGQNLSGWAKIRLKGEPGQKISLHYDEALNEKASFWAGSLPFPRAKSCATPTSTSAPVAGRSGSLTSATMASVMSRWTTHQRNSKSPPGKFTPT